jgi:glycosyltransferase involved in cell wall biosynthesis
LPEDAFIVGMVAANKGVSPPRKAFPQVLQAFAKLREKHEDAYLYLHSDITSPQGMAIGRLAEQLGIPDEAVKSTTPLQLELGVPDAQMAELYSAFDVLANPSYGEGFGVPIIEAQSCGTRAIVTDCTAMRELCGPGSWLVPGEPWYDAQQNAFLTCPSVDGILEAMREAYASRGDGPDLEARRFALDYDADVVTKRYWRPALVELGDLAPRLAAA